MKRFNKIQSNYLTALTAFETAKKGYEAELVETGLQARIDAATDEKTLDAIEIEDAPIFAKWNVKKLEQALSRTEDRLLDWSLNVAIELKPENRITMNSLRDTLHGLTRHDPKKAECLKLAMRLPA